MRDRSWKEIGPALGSGSQFRNAHKTKRAALVLASVALLAAVAHVTNKKSTNKNLFSDRGHPGCLPPQVTRVPKKPLAAVHWANGCQLPLLNTARGGLRVVANVVEQMFYKIQRLLLQQEQKSKMQQQAALGGSSSGRSAKSGVRFGPWFWCSLSVTAFDFERF